MQCQLRTCRRASPALVFLLVLSHLFPALSGGAPLELQPENTLFLDLTASVINQPKADLLPGQVRISVNGVPRDLIYFSRITPDLLNSGDPNSWVIANQLRGECALIIVLDLNNLDNAALNSTRLTIRSILESLPENQNQKFMLVTLGSRLSFIQTFTSDKTRIVSAADEIRATTGRMDYKSLIEAISEAFTIQYDQNPGQAMEEAIREANQFMIQVRGRAQSTIAGLEVLSEWFTGLSGPKKMLLFSGGYPLVPAPVVHDIIRAYNQTNVSSDIIPASLMSAKIGTGSESVTSEEMASLMAKMNRNQITLYTFDSRDIKSDSLAASNIRWLSPRLVARHNSSHITAGREFLEEISEPTRGALISTADKLIDTVNEIGQAGYIAAIKAIPGEEPGEKDLKIEVEITDAAGNQDKSVDVRWRKGLFTLLAGNSEESLAGAFNFPYYHRDFSVSFKVGTGQGRLAVQAVIPPSELRFNSEKDNYFCMLEIFGLLTDSEGKTLTGDKKYTFARQFPIRMNEAQLQKLRLRDSVSADASADGILPGDYTLTVVVRQPRSGLISASRMNLSVAAGAQ